MVRKLLREDLERLLPHRRIALVIDEVLFDPETPNFIQGKKTLKSDDPYFDGHFDDDPIFPGHWSVEAVALAAAAMIKLTRIKLQEGLPYFLGIEKFDFKRPIRPGDTMRILVRLISTEPRRNIFTFQGEIINQENRIVAAGNIRGTIVLTKKEVTLEKQ